jgi:hypothetical protein
MNKEQRKIYMLTYRKNHPENIKAYNDTFRYGGNRQAVLERDKFTCQLCGMTDEEHRQLFGRSISIDHKDGNGRNAQVKNHSIDNLWTLCLPCHSRKDGSMKRKLTAEDVRQIRVNAQNSVTELAKKYSVSRTLIYDIRNGKRHKAIGAQPENREG